MTKEALLDHVDQISPLLTEVSRKIWESPEAANEEVVSSERMRAVLRNEGFVIVDIADMPTAFYAEFGAGKPVLAILGEYDALPGLSQDSESGTRKPLEENGPGHGCGHNLLGTGALGAALALKAYLEKSGASGTIRYYGCPAEETLDGKPKMIAKGAFDGCDAALSWHPMTSNSPYLEAFLANVSIKFRFRGKTSHAAFSPHLGRSALDAVELMNVGANYLREHVIDKARIHYTTNSCGFPPNIVPDRAESWYFVRAPHQSDVAEIAERLKKVAQGAAMMTETTVEWATLGGCCEMLPNAVMERLTRENMEAIPGPAYTAEELAFAEKLLESVPVEQLRLERATYGRNPEKAPPLFDGVASRETVSKAALCGSSDSGDVSYLMPMNLFTATCAPLGATAHTWLITACAGNSIGQKGMLYAAKVLAGVGYDLLSRPQELAAAKEEFDGISAQRPYQPFPVEPF